MLLRVTQAVDGVGHIVSSHLGAIGKVHVLPQSEVPGSVIHLLIALSSVAHDLPLGVRLDQGAVKGGQNAGGDGGVAVSGVQAGDVAGAGPCHRLNSFPAALRGLAGAVGAGFSAAAAEQPHAERQCKGKRECFFHVGVPPFLVG